MAGCKWRVWGDARACETRKRNQSPDCPLITRVMLPIPRIQAIRYPTLPGEDVVYGLRLSVSPWPLHSPACNTFRKDWSAEIGKISDESLKSHLVGG